MSSAQMDLRQSQVEAALKVSAVVAVVVIERLADAVPLARALVAGGMRAIEVTLRTPVALDAIRAIAAEVGDAVVGAGTLLTPADLLASLKAGARFGVSPGFTPGLLDAADASPLPYLPGAATAAEAMFLLERGYRFQKFFPATQAGGPEYLRALASPLPNIRFCPTGGISVATAASWLSLANVACIGGSWVCSPAMVRAGEWQAIESLAQAASALRISPQV